MTYEDKMLYDELDVYEQYEYDWESTDFVFEDLFDVGKDKRFVVCGRVGLWDGERTGYLPKSFFSIKEAILNANNGFNGYIKVYEGKYGRLYLDINHHDGNNHLEIRELTRLGEDLEDLCYDMDDILNRKGATRNVKFFKRYLGV